MQASPPLQIPTYTLLRPLGSGGFAQVWLGEHAFNKRLVAIKVLRDLSGHGLDFEAAFLREAQVMASFNEPNIAKIYDNGRAEGCSYIVMEYLAGGSLADAIDRKRPTPLQTAECVAQIAAALDIVHANGVVHRDLKPANVLMRDERTPVLTDFGISRVATRSTIFGSSRIGTPAYMSPEQIAGEPLDGRSDFYALGILLYEMLTGQLPHGGSDSEVAIRRLNGGPTFLPAEYAAFQPLLNRLLVRSPQQRYASGAQLGADLRLIAGMIGSDHAPLPALSEITKPFPSATPAPAAAERPVAAHTPTQTFAVSRPAAISTAMLVLVLLLTAAFFVGKGRSPETGAVTIPAQPAATAAATPAQDEKAAPIAGSEESKKNEEEQARTDNAIFAGLPRELMGPVIEPLTEAEVERIGAICPCKFWTESQLDKGGSWQKTPMVLWDTTREKVYVNENSGLRTLEVRRTEAKSEVLNPPEHPEDLRHFEFSSDRLHVNAIVRDTRCYSNEPDCDERVKSMRFTMSNMRGRGLLKLTGMCGCSP